MVIHRHFVTLMIIVVILCILGFFPIHYPVQTFDEDPDPGQVVPLHQNQPLMYTVQPPENFWSGIAVWTNDRLSTPPDTPLILTIASHGSTTPLRTVHTTLYKVFHQTPRVVRFTFLPIPHAQGVQYDIVLTAPTLTIDHALPIRLSLITDEESKSMPIAYELLTTKPVIVALVREESTAATEGQDIYYYWHRGSQILHGRNPYVCTIDNTCLDNKNPGHFPLFYWLSALSQKLGLQDYTRWIAFWRPVFILAGLATGLVIFFTLYRRGQPVLALFGLLFWLLNRWTLYVARVGQIDFLAILFLVLSLALFEKRRKLSLFLFSVSLGFKQLAIFLVPLYLVILWRRSEKLDFKSSVQYLLLIASVPFITSLPFLLNKPRALLWGIFFSVTRDSEFDLGAASFSRLIHLQGAASIIFMLLLMGFVYLVAWRKRIPLSIGALAVYLVFIAFNTVVLHQYFLWFMALIPLALSESLLQYQPASPPDTKL